MFSCLQENKWWLQDIGLYKDPRTADNMGKDAVRVGQGNDDEKSRGKRHRRHPFFFLSARSVVCGLDETSMACPNVFPCRCGEDDCFAGGTYEHAGKGLGVRSGSAPTCIDRSVG